MKKKKMTGTQMLAEMGYEPFDAGASVYVAAFKRKTGDKDGYRILIDQEGFVHFETGNSNRSYSYKQEIRAVAALLDELEEQGVLKG